MRLLSQVNAARLVAWRYRSGWLTHKLHSRSFFNPRRLNRLNYNPVGLARRFLTNRERASRVRRLTTGGAPFVAASIAEVVDALDAQIAVGALASVADLLASRLARLCLLAASRHF